VLLLDVEAVEALFIGNFQRCPSFQCWNPASITMTTDLYMEAWQSLFIRAPECFPVHCETCLSCKWRVTAENQGPTAPVTPWPSLFTRVSHLTSWGGPYNSSFTVFVVLNHQDTGNFMKPESREGFFGKPRPRLPRHLMFRWIVRVDHRVSSSSRYLSSSFQMLHLRYIMTLCLSWILLRMLNIWMILILGFDFNHFLLQVSRARCRLRSSRLCRACRCRIAGLGSCSAHAFSMDVHTDNYQCNYKQDTISTIKSVMHLY